MWGTYVYQHQCQPHSKTLPCTERHSSNPMCSFRWSLQRTSLLYSHYPRRIECTTEYRRSRGDPPFCRPFRYFQPSRRVTTRTTRPQRALHVSQDALSCLWYHAHSPRPDSHGSCRYPRTYERHTNLGAPGEYMNLWSLRTRVAAVTPRLRYNLGKYRCGCAPRPGDLKLHQQLPVQVRQGAPTLRRLDDG